MMMKKWMTVVCALMMICLAATAFAEVPTSNLYTPNTSETLKSLIGGKTFEARITGWGSYGEDEDARFDISITVCERDRFDLSVIDNLAENDIIRFGDGTTFMVKEVIRDEFGVIAKDGFNSGYSFFKAEDGNAYIASTDTDNPFYTDIFTVTVPLEKDISFLDWSDPENLDAPVKRVFDDLLTLIQEGTNFSPYNTKVTFDENGKLVEFLYTYSPWN
jgi:hypothetical protein